MEKGINASIREWFALEEVDIRTYSPLALAYIGDGIFELVIRSIVVGRGNRRPGELDRRTSHFAKAQTQAKLAEKLLPFLTEEELAAYRRGRNAHSLTVARLASVQYYRKATGLEALFGFLYLTDRFDRILFLVQKGLEELGERI